MAGGQIEKLNFLIEFIFLGEYKNAEWIKKIDWKQMLYECINNQIDNVTINNKRNNLIYHNTIFERWFSILKYYYKIKDKYELKTLDIQQIFEKLAIYNINNSAIYIYEIEKDKINLYNNDNYVFKNCNIDVLRLLYNLNNSLYEIEIDSSWKNYKNHYILRFKKTINEQQQYFIKEINNLTAKINRYELEIKKNK